ncbi:hypothetical protein G6N05_12725 [Flavobacterium sp. F372]|jgi:hypothetical protein|uniref:Addiction module protein n=1 Tax=Flavobacterium bernardetii TaxID=2813823 RepID=A0ABR7J0T2_9FLAO|nr:hypothetical protein [Flavobacterium bernardetii]MBC5835612.1 hypothetical protein [Flavobacterium bernardetii]NHF70976.1 hypothetical protein [Flavobacterium bernardetii]
MDLQLEKIELIELLLNTKKEAVLKKLRAILEKDQEINLTTEDYDIIDKRRELHLKNETKSYSWEEVKSNARLAK